MTSRSPRLSDRYFEEYLFQDPIQYHGTDILAWESHGHRYGITNLEEQVNQHQTTMFPVSVYAIPKVRGRFPKCVSVFLTASPNILEARLKLRNGELTDISYRLAEAEQESRSADLADMLINAELPEEAMIEQFIEKVYRS